MMITAKLKIARTMTASRSVKAGAVRPHERSILRDNMWCLPDYVSMRLPEILNEAPELQNFPKLVARWKRNRRSPRRSDRRQISCPTPLPANTSRLIRVAVHAGRPLGHEIFPQRVVPRDAAYRIKRLVLLELADDLADVPVGITDVAGGVLVVAEAEIPWYGKPAATGSMFL